MIENGKSWTMMMKYFNVCYDKKNKLFSVSFDVLSKIFKSNIINVGEDVMIVIGMSHLK